MFRSKVPRLFAGFGLMHRTYCTSVPVMESMSADSCDLNLVVTVSAFKKLCRAFFFAPWILPSMSRVKIFKRRLLVVVSISCFNSDGIASLFRSMNPPVLVVHGNETKQRDITLCRKNGKGEEEIQWGDTGNTFEYVTQRRGVEECMGDRQEG
jgi:hypothetical protein